jgi:predicted NBD/HSP70 family sugar kinase
VTSAWPRPAAHAGTGSRPDDLRRANRAAVVRTLHLRGATNRAALAAGLELNRSTIKSVVDALARDGVVVESLPVGRQGAGRPSMVVTPCPRAAWVVAVEVAVGWLTVAAVGLGGTVLGQRGAGPVRREVDPSELVGRVVDAVSALSAELGSRPSAMGVGVPGLVRADDGLVRRAPNLGWSDVPLGELLTAATGLGVLVRNESDLGALAEHVRGCARDVDDLVFLVVDVGVGGGVISGGVSIDGAGGYAGEVGHMAVRRDGRECRCGSSGCWETEVGEGALRRAVGLPTQGPRSHLRRELVRLRNVGAPPPDELVEYGRWLAMGVGNLVNLLDPEVVVFGGLLADALPLVVDTLTEHVAAACLLARPTALVALVPSALGASGPLVGAAEVAFAGILDGI